MISKLYSISHEVILAQYEPFLVIYHNSTSNGLVVLFKSKFQVRMNFGSGSFTNEQSKIRLVNI